MEKYSYESTVDDNVSVLYSFCIFVQIENNVKLKIKISIKCQSSFALQLLSFIWPLKFLRIYRKNIDLLTILSLAKTQPTISAYFKNNCKSGYLILGLRFAMGLRFKIHFVLPPASWMKHRHNQQ